MYWEIGKFVSKKVNEGAWGDGVVKNLSDYILVQFPNLKGFTKRGLYRMKQFYETYHDNKKVSAPMTQIQKTVDKIFKDTYVFEFLDLPTQYNEKDLQQALIQNLKTFLTHCRSI